MKKNILLLFISLILLAVYFSPVILKHTLPIPADTIIGMYNPFRDYYVKDYPNGIPYKNFLITDPVRQQYPWKKLVINQWSSFQLPLWNPYNFTGTPLLANFQSGVFSPFNLFFFVLPFQYSWTILIILQPFLAGLFLYYYLKNLQLHTLAASLGAIIFSFCGFATAWMEWGTILQTAMWLPLLLLSVDKLYLKSGKTERSKYVWSLIFLFSICASFFAGHLQTFIYLFTIVLCYLVARTIQFRKQKTRKYWISILIVLFFLLTAVQWYPTIQFILQSARDVDQVNNWQKPEWFIPWQNLIQFIAPDFFGNPTTLNYWGIWNYGEFVGYIGILPLIMALYSLYNRQDKKTLFFGAIFFMSLIFALPTLLAKIPYILNIPFLSSTQPTRLMFLIDFSLAVLAALGLDLFIKETKKKRILYPILFLLLIFIFLWGFVFYGHKLFQEITMENIVVSKRNLYFPTAIFFISAVLLLFINYFKRMKREIKLVLLICLIGISFFDVIRFSQKFNTFSKIEYLYPLTQSLSFLKQQQGQFRIMTTNDEILPPNFAAVYKIQSLDGYDPLYLQRYAELMVALKRNKPDITPPYGFNRIITPHNINTNLTNLLGVKYILSFDQLKDSNLILKYRESKTMIYENKDVFPRVFFVSNIIPAGNKQEAIKNMFNANIDFHTSAVVENWNMPTKSYGKGSANIVEYNENKVVVRASNKQNSYLVLMDAYYPTWQAKICDINGSSCSESKIFITNYNYRGTIVPAGEHIITFTMKWL